MPVTWQSPQWHELRDQETTSQVAPLSDVPQVLCMIELLLRHAAPISPGGERLEGDKASVGRIGFQPQLDKTHLA